MGLLRFFLAFSVVIVHGRLLSFNLIYADIAVQTFYIISGFYMAMVLNEKYNRPDVTYIDFIYSRFFRIAPAYFIVLILTIITTLIAWYGFSSKLPPLQHWQELINEMSVTSIIYVIVPQFLLLGLDVINFFTLDLSGNLVFTYEFKEELIKLWYLMAVPQGWTLALEFYFYMLAPFVVKRPVKFIISIIVISFIVRLTLIIFLGYQHDPWLYRFFPSELMFFLSGSLAYRNSKSLVMNDSGTIKIVNLVCFCLILIAGVFSRYGQLGGNAYLFSPLFMGVIFLILPKLFALTKNIKVDKYIGELSYPLYISHVLVIWISNSMMLPGSLEQRITVALGSIVFAIIIYELVDKRVDVFRHRKFSKEVSRE